MVNFFIQCPIFASAIASMVLAGWICHFPLPVKAKMDELAKRFPSGIDNAMRYDNMQLVSATMRNVLIPLAEALVLVVIVTFGATQRSRC
jgi:hypothetical protein